MGYRRYETCLISAPDPPIGFGDQISSFVDLQSGLPLISPWQPDIDGSSHDLWFLWWLMFSSLNTRTTKKT